MRINYFAEPTIARFHGSPAFVRGIRGPIGSGKSVGCALEIFKNAYDQKPHNGISSVRWAIIRNTYGELKTTTIPTWQDWFGDFTRIIFSHPISGKVLVKDKNRTIELELIFLALDKPKDIKKLKSLELTGVWLNEASEIPQAILNMATGRVNRYPSKRMGGPTRSCIIMDTNSCDIDNWWYSLAEEEKPENYEFFSQPPALVPLGGGGFAPNPKAENIINQPAGFDYYLKQLPGKPKEWVKVFILNQYGRSEPGSYIYDDYLPDLKGNHTNREFNPELGHIIWTHDFNFTPMSSAIIQVDVENIYMVDEIVLKSAVAKQSALEFVERYKEHKNCVVKVYGDASGRKGEKHGHDSDYTEIERILKKAGFRVQMKQPRANPSIKDSQNSLRGKICDATGKRAFFVNPAKCKYGDKGLQTVQLKEGSTFQEEDSEYQHITTALRYFTSVEFPIKKRIGFSQAV